MFVGLRGRHVRLLDAARTVRGKASGLGTVALLLLVTDFGNSSVARAQETASASETGGELETVIVSARKREESLATVPVSITAFTAETLNTYNIQSFNDYATKTPGLSFTYGTGPTGIAAARTVAIRGITGQNFFGTGGATGFYIDDTPVPGSIDPRVVDLASIEVLRGPQGTLFGESSLAGNVRLITRAPDVGDTGYGYTLAVGGTSGGGSADGRADLIGNLALSPGRAAVRLVLFANHDAGYLTRTYPTESDGPAASDPMVSVPRTSVGGQGAISTGGGSLALLLKASSNLDVQLRVMFQDSRDHGFPATFAPLPEFTPVYRLDRAFDVQPYATDTWTLPSLDLKWTGTGYTAVWNNSYYYRHTRDLEDSSYGTQQVLAAYYGVAGLPSQPYLWDGERYHDQFTSEARLSFAPIHKISGTFGLYYANTHTRFTIPPTYAQGLSSATVGGQPAGSICTPVCQGDLIWTQTDPGTEEDKSIFGELYWNFAQKWTLTLGARQYWLKQTADFTADGFLNLGPTPSAPQQNSQSGLNPKFALSIQANEATMLYASASKGFRAGGAQPFLTFCSEPGLPVDDITHLKSDTLWSYELGSKVQVPDVLFSAAVYHIDWLNLQQQVALPCGYYLQVNGNEARVNGGELEASGRVADALSYRVGLGYEDASIIDPGPLGSVGIKADSRVGGVPAFTAFLSGVYTHPLSAQVSGFVAADYSYTADSVSLLVSGGKNAPLATRPGYSLVNLRFGMDRGQSELSLNLHNLFNAKPNLGDIGYVGYAQFNSAGTVIPQVVTLQPLTATLQYTKSF